MNVWKEHIPYIIYAVLTVTFLGMFMTTIKSCQMHRDKCNLELKKAYLEQLKVPPEVLESLGDMSGCGRVER